MDDIADGRSAPALQGITASQSAPLGIFVGMSTLDIVHYVDRLPGPNEKLFAEDRLVAAGGPATNAAIAFAALGGSAVLVSRLGSHPLARVVADELARHGVQHFDLAPDDTCSPIVSAINVTIGTGDRSVVSSTTPAADPPLASAQLASLPLGAARVVLVDGHQPGAALGVASAARDAEVPVVLDGGSWKSGTGDVLRYVDYAICSEVFQPPGCAGSGDVLDCLADLGIAHRAVTRGPRPVRWSCSRAAGAAVVVDADPPDGPVGGLADRDTDVGEGPVGEHLADRNARTHSGEVCVPQPSAVVDSLGAGDVFHGAFCYYLAATDLSFRGALHAASEVAARSCTVRGARIVPP